MSQFHIKQILKKEGIALKSHRKEDIFMCNFKGEQGKIGCRVNVEFYEDEEKESYQTTKWYKGTININSKRGHVVTFDGYGPEHNEIIWHL